METKDQILRFIVELLFVLLTIVSHSHGTTGEEFLKVKELHERWKALQDYLDLGGSSK